MNHQYEFADYRTPVAADMEFEDRIYPKNPGSVPQQYNPIDYCAQSQQTYGFYWIPFESKARSELVALSKEYFARGTAP